MWEAGHCIPCREEDCIDCDDQSDLPVCGDHVMCRKNNGVCSCDSESDANGFNCRYCGLGCADCEVDKTGYSTCNSCRDNYYKFEIIPGHFYCGFIPDTLNPPLGMYIDGEHVKQEAAGLFKFSFYEQDMCSWPAAGSAVFMPYAFWFTEY
jgi:hypothetical protein